jgi:hypothetical protein
MYTTSPRSTSIANLHEAGAAASDLYVFESTYVDNTTLALGVHQIRKQLTASRDVETGLGFPASALPALQIFWALNRQMRTV